MVDTVYKIQHRRGTIGDWTLANPILGDGEIGVLTGTSLAKMGDGVTPWVDLPYFNVVPSDDIPLGDGAASAGVSDEVSRADHIHPGSGDFLPLTGGTLSGDLTINEPGSYPQLFLKGQFPRMHLDNTSGDSGYPELSFERGSVSRWLMRTTNNTEPDATGKANSGTDLSLVSRNDDGSSRKSIFSVNRESGVFHHLSPMIVGLLGSTMYQNPHAASMYNSNASIAGYLLVKMPLTAQNTFVQIRIRGYNYNIGNGEWELNAGGHMYSSGWVINRGSVRVDGRFPGGKRRLPVRFQTRGSSGAREFAIAIGDASTVWSYPTVVVEIIGNSSYVADSNVAVSITTDITTPDWTTVETINPDTPYVPNAGEFRYMSHPSQSIANAADVVTVGWTALAGDSGNGAVSYSNGAFTVNASGLYDISWFFSFVSNTTGVRVLIFNINDSSVIIERPAVVSTGHATGTICFHAFALSSGDVLKLIGHQTSGAALALSGRMSIRKVGELP